MLFDIITIQLTENTFCRVTPRHNKYRINITHEQKRSIVRCKNSNNITMFPLGYFRFYDLRLTAAAAAYNGRTLAHTHAHTRTRRIIRLLFF